MTSLSHSQERGKTSKLAMAMFAEAFEGKLVLTDLEEPHRYYTCPCGGTDHLASRSSEAFDSPLLPDGYSPVLHCWETDKQWYLVEGREVTAGIIRNEERRYHELLDKAPDILQRYMTKRKLGIGGLSDEHFADLHSTYGLDRDTVESVLFGESGVRVGEEREGAQ